MAAFVDEAMKEYGGKEWQYDMQTAPCYTVKHTTDIEAPLTVADLLRCCRPPAGVKSANLLLDARLSIADCGTPENIASAVQNQRVDELPAALQFAEPLPEQTKVGCIVAADGHGRLDVIKIIFFESKMLVSQVIKKICGSPYLTFHRQGPWAVRKAFQSLLDRVPGHHVQWAKVCRKVTVSTKSIATAPIWAPDDTELLQGISFINENAPESDAHNEQYAWILMNIKEDSDRPIAGWPEGKVRIMAQNKTRAAGIPIDYLLSKAHAVRYNLASAVPSLCTLWSLVPWMAWCG